MTTYTATEYEEMIRTEAAPIPVGYCIRDDGYGMCAVSKAEPDAALEAFHEALYDAAQRMLSHYAESPLGARVYVCVQADPADDHTVTRLAGALVENRDGDVDEVLCGCGEFCEDTVEHVSDVLQAYLNDPAHPLRVALDAYKEAVKTALTRAAAGCWTVGDDEIEMDQEMLDLLKAEGVDL